MQYKLLVKSWREHLNEIGMSQASLGVSDEEYKKIMAPAKAKISPGLKDLYDIIAILDPTSFTSYPEAFRAIQNFKKQPSYYNGVMLTLSLLSLIPVAGKAAKGAQIGLRKLNPESVMSAAQKMETVLNKVPGGAGAAGKIAAAYDKQAEIRGRSPS